MPDNLSKIKGFLLGTTLIADSLNNAINISKQINHRTRIVTLDGQVVNAGGSLTGGANRHDNQGVLVQKNELESLNKSTAQMDQKLAQNEEQLQSAKDELAKIEASHERGQQKAFQLKQQVKGLADDCQLVEQTITDKQREIKTLELAMKNAMQPEQETASSTLSKQQDTIDEQLKMTNDQLDSKQVQLANVKETAQKYAVEKQSLHERLSSSNKSSTS